MIAYKYTVTGGATSVSGADDNGLTLTYTVGKEQVYINGVLQVRGSDYTATTGSSITGITAMLASDIVTVLAFTAFSISNTYTQAEADAKFFQTANAFLAGKNKIINGDFAINQRAFTSNTTSASFNFDRWAQINTGGTFTVTPQVFTPGAAPVAGYEATNFLRGVSASQSAVGDRAVFRQKIEDVRTFAGQTITISFWAKAGSGTPKIGIEVAQEPTTPFTSIPVSAVTISTSWVRYSATVAVPSLSGVSISAGNNFSLFLWLSAGSDWATRASSIGIQNNTFDIWGVQVEAGSIATPFQTATGTIQGELAACQRYYFRITPSAAGENYGVGFIGGGLGDLNALVSFPVQMRVKPTALEQSGTAADYTILNSAGATACSAVPAYVTSTTTNSRIQLVTLGTFTASSCAIGRAANTNAYLGWSAEL
jgi:hypothetical protein